MSYPSPNPILGHNFIAPDTISYRNLYNIVREDTLAKDTIMSCNNTDCIGSCKSNYHTITTTTAPNILMCCLIDTKV